MEVNSGFSVLQGLCKFLYNIKVTNSLYVGRVAHVAFNAQSWPLTAAIS